MAPPEAANKMTAINELSGSIPGFPVEQKYVSDGAMLSFVSLYNGARADFKAYITGFMDNYNSNWASEQPYGKADPIRHFSNTERTINISWSVVAKDINEAKSNIRRISALAQMLYPVYENRGSLFLSESVDEIVDR